MDKPSINGNEEKKVKTFCLGWKRIFGSKNDNINVYFYNYIKLKILEEIITYLTYKVVDVNEDWQKLTINHLLIFI